MPTRSIYVGTNNDEHIYTLFFVCLFVVVVFLR